MIKNDDERREFFRGVSVAPDTLLEQWTARLYAGETGPSAEGIARRIVHDFIMRVWLDKPQSKVALAWLAEVFEQIYDDRAEPSTALLLPKRPANRPKGSAIAKAMDVAWWVNLAMERGYNEAEANKLAAERFACDVRHVRRMRKDAPTGRQH